MSTNPRKTSKIKLEGAVMSTRREQAARVQLSSERLYIFAFWVAILPPRSTTSSFYYFLRPQSALLEGGGAPTTRGYLRIYGSTTLRKK